MKRKVVRKYLAASADLLPALADVGAEPLETAAETSEHASDEEEETESSPLRRNPRSVKL